MSTAEHLSNAMDAALNTARGEYRSAVLELASQQADKIDTPRREPADVDRIHHARTRVIALDAARDELGRMIEKGVSLPIQR